MEMEKAAASGGNVDDVGRVSVKYSFLVKKCIQIISFFKVDGETKATRHTEATKKKPN